jgi:hypothetical protein
MKRPTLLGVLGLCALGCGGSSYAYESEPASVERSGGYDYATDDDSAGAPIAMDSPASAESYGGADWGDASFESEPSPEPNRSVSDVLNEARPQMAQATQPPEEAQGTPSGQTAGETTDGVDLSGPLLIYTARFHLGVYEVTQTQEAILEQLAELGVMLSRRSDAELVIRVPAARFQQALDLVEGAGDVLHREVNAMDVGEEFRDVAIRLRNAEVMRERLERLLARADAVEDALAIERELQRLTDVIELLKGRQRYLTDQIRFSTITIVFQALSTEPTGPDGFTLPFDWLGELGLSNLMRLQ